MDNIVSWCVGDANNDGIDEILFIRGSNKTNKKDELYGNSLSICDIKYIDNIKGNDVKNVDTTFSINLESLKPMKVMVGDINGDGLNEISLCVYKSTKFHPELAKRPFFYLLEADKLVPVWRGSCLSRPFDDYELFDMDDDGIDEIVAIERLEDGKRLLAVYSWLNFGFVKDSESAGYDGGLSFKSTDNLGNKVKMVTENGNNYFFYYDEACKKILLEKGEIEL
jgi:dTDP-glucose pyrophosphorylase